MTEQKTQAVERYKEHLNRDKVPYHDGGMTRISNVSKTKILILRARFGQKSDASVIATLLAMFEEDLGEVIE